MEESSFHVYGFTVGYTVWDFNLVIFYRYLRQISTFTMDVGDFLRPMSNEGTFICHSYLFTGRHQLINIHCWGLVNNDSCPSIFFFFFFAGWHVSQISFFLCTLRQSEELSPVYLNLSLRPSFPLFHIWIKRIHVSRFPRGLRFTTEGNGRWLNVNY